MSFGGRFHKPDGSSLGTPSEVKVLLVQAFPVTGLPFIRVERPATLPAIPEALSRLLNLTTTVTFPYWEWSFSVGQDDHGVEIQFNDTPSVHTVFMTIYGRGTDAGFAVIQNAVDTLERQAGWRIQMD